MDQWSLFKQRDVEIRVGGMRILLTKELRAKIRRIARFTTVASGAMGTLMGAVIVIGSLIAEDTLIPALVCAGITICTVKVVGRR